MSQQIPFMEQFIAARNASVPLVGIRTSDIEAAINRIKVHPEQKDYPMILWDCVRGLSPINTAGTRLIEQLFATHKPNMWMNPIEMLVKAAERTSHPSAKEITWRIPPETMIFAANLHRFLNDPGVAQGILNLRPIFKSNSRTLILIGPEMKLPSEINRDVIVMHEPLPDADFMEGVVRVTYDAVKLKQPDPQTMELCKDAIVGLTAFEAEQVSSMSIRKSGMDIPFMYERKRVQIECPGMKVWRGSEMFNGKYGIGGCNNSKKFLVDVANGRERPRCVIFQDEVEKQYAGLRGESSGVTQEMLGMQLGFMQDTNATGLMLFGQSGVAKSHLAKAIGNEAGIPVIQLTLGNAKGGIVGQSNEQMQTMLDRIDAISQGRALWIATSNDLSILPDEFLARYTFGTFFFDLPLPSARPAIWDIYHEFFGISTKNNPKPDDTGWTGREIRTCCMLAYRTNRTLLEAAQNISPSWISNRERIRARRQLAHQRYISADYPGLYQAPEGDQPDPTQTPEMQIVIGTIQSGGRRIRLPEEPTPAETKDDTNSSTGKKKLVN